MNENKFRKMKERIERRNRDVEQRKELDAEKKYGTRKIETHKALALYLFMLLNIIIVYSLVAMWRFADLSYLGVLISDIAAQVLVYTIYCLKSFKGKQAEENLKFERQKYEDSLQAVLSAGADENET